MFIYPYRVGSNSVKSLADCLGLLVIKREASRFRGRRNKKVINWGASELPEEVLKSSIINNPNSVKLACNKLDCFKVLKAFGVSIPPFTIIHNTAIEWLENNKTVVARKILTGHSGNGIEILEKGLDFVEAPCYTIYIPKSSEYRVHVFGGEVIDVQRKIKDPERDVTDWKIRSYQNGFIFVRSTPDGQSYKELIEKDCLEQSVRAVQALGLDFAAVDVIFNKKQNKAFVLEVNCAPGLEGQSIEVYANAFRKVM